ncbi:hypothetical protein B0T19DRAFT_451403 [Cercophora scortea]|uniref:Uncharacterized protein n=1 Tax=Cercophora scortea TaxID=314031 RepID=A0AAE0I849_9PEZI|nr:hypothetical protein B0T19DRAFT_451403 [Cercophora scortea]
MDHTSTTERWGPQIYLHVEFGVSFSSRHPPKNHEVDISYRSSRSPRRSSQFPRQVPAANTNYLAAIHEFEQRQSARRENRHANYQHQHQHQQHHHHHYQGHREEHPGAGTQHQHQHQHQHQQPQFHCHHQMQEYYQRQHEHHSQPHQRLPPAQGRQSRADSQSSHERGHSAPPPINDSPWDVSFPLSQPGDLNPEALSSQPPLNQSKPLPAVPAQFRLGADGTSWSSWSWPMGYDPAVHPHDESDAASSFAQSTSGQNMPSVFSPESSRNLPDPGRAQELGALSAAMMTVDNGFENQRWNHGDKEHFHEDEAAADEENLASIRSLGWALADVPKSLGEQQTPPSSSLASANIVSPLSDYSILSPPAASQPQMRRATSTRSEGGWSP